MQLFQKPLTGLASVWRFGW